MKLSHILFALGTAIIACPATNALDINTEKAGSLRRAIETPAEVTTLAVTGLVDASDLYFIGREMTSLTSLDLSKASIEAYYGSAINGIKSFQAGVIPTGAFAGLPLTKVVFPAEGNVTIADCAFQGTRLTEVSLPANVDSVGMGAFSYCPALESVVMPSTTRLGSDIFADCPSLTTADMAGASVLPASTFRNCPALTDVKGSETLTVIGDNAFLGDSALSGFEFGRSLKSIGDAAFAGTGLTDIDLSSATSMKDLGGRAFAKSAVTSVVLPDNISIIGEGSFFDASALTAVNIPAATITIADHALKGTPVAALELPEGLEEIGDYSFMGADKVANLVLPSTLIHVGNHAMQNMTGLTEISAYALSAVPQTGDDVWLGVDQPSVKLVVNDVAESDFRNAPQWQKFNIEVATGVDDITGDITATDVKGRFVGTDLELTSTGADMSVVRLFDTAGRLVTAVEPHDTAVTIDTAAFPAGVFVVSVVLDNNAVATLKLARR